MENKNSKLKNKWYVFKANNPSAHIFLMIILINVIFILLSACLICFLPENVERSFPETIRFAFTLMVNPSGRYVYSDYPVSTIITTIVVLLGMISLTGGTVGYITSIINGILEKSAKSKGKLKIKDHIVILNYNNKVPSLIFDYCFDDIENTYITVLSRVDKDQVKNEIDMMYNRNGVKKKFKNIIVRDGNPMSKLDLDAIALKDAKTVILALPESEDDSVSGNIKMNQASFEMSKLFMFVTSYFSEINTGSKTNIVVEVNNTELENMVKEYHLDNLNQTSIPVNYNEIIGKMLALTSVMPSLYKVMQQIFSFEGVEIYIEDKPDTKISDVIKTSRSIIPLYDLEDSRVYIAEDESEFDKLDAKKDFKLNKALPKETLVPQVEFGKKNIVIVGMNSKLDYILESLSCIKNEYGIKDLNVQLVDTEENAERLEAFYSNPAYKDILVADEKKAIIVKDIFNPANDIGEEVIKNMSSMLLLSDDTISATHIDEKPLLFWSRLKDVCHKADKKDIIVEILDSQNQNIIEKKNKDQVIVSDSFLGQLYAQLGKTPRRIDVIKDLITSEGDTSSRDINQNMQNDCNLIALSVKNFFAGCKEDLTFASKRELAVWAYEATKGAYLPIGIVRDGVDYLFSRTDSANDDLDSAVLLAKESGNVIDDGNIKLRDEDELVLLKLM